MFIDTHCHLTFPELRERWDDIRAAMRAAQVERAIVICTTIEEFDTVHALAAQHDFLWCTVGVHPDNEDVHEPDVAELVRLVDRVREAMGRGIVVLTAPTGAGKSSLLAAGLIAGATADGALTGWSVETMTPTEIRRSSPAQLIVIDQFEDVFETGSQQAAELVARVVQLAEHAVVVLGLRSGAFGVASEYAELVPALEHAMLLAPMSADQLTEVIVEPARQVGVSVEPELVAALLRDVAPGDASPGRARVLPLLSNMLLALWLAGDGRQLTVADY